MNKSESRRSFIKKSATASAGLTFGISTLNAAGLISVFGTNYNIDYKRSGRKISFNLPLKDNVPAVEVRLYSNANKYIFEYDDVSQNAPKVKNEQTKDVWMPGYDEQAVIRRQSSSEKRFPVVDLVVAQNMEAVVDFNRVEQGKYNFNEHGFKLLSKEVRIPNNQVDHWGNTLILDPKTNSIKGFYLTSKVKVDASKVTFEFDTLRDDWEGLISVHQVDTKELIASTAVLWDVKLPEISTGTGVSRERMISSLSWATKHILDCENTNPDSEAFGGEYLLYDLSAKTRLRSFWSWAWGPSAKMMLEASKIKGVDTGITNRQLKQRAIDLMGVTLKKQVLDPSSPAYGVVQTSLHEASTVDTLFLVGWGWMPLYRETGDSSYIDAGKKVVDAANRLMDQYVDMIPQAYLFERKTWKKIMSFESSMGLPGLAGLYLATGNEYYKRTTIRLANLLIKAFEKENGLWGVFFYEETRTSSEVNYWTKAFGYIADGLIEAHKVAPDQGYLKKVVRIAEQVMDSQALDGSFAVRFDRSAEFVGIGDKATALWAGLFIRIYKLNGDKIYYNAGMKALEWCMDHQYFGQDSIARGAIVGRSWPSGITFRHWFDVVVTYTVSFFGNSLIEALSLDEFQK
ncbi:MAG: hypothetical protein ABJN84_12745 [Flavobacteriaceae bacterium]